MKAVHAFRTLSDNRATH